MPGSSDSWWVPCPSCMWPPSGQKGSHRCRLTHALPPGVWVLTCFRSPPNSQPQTGILLEPLFLSKMCRWHPTSLQTACWWTLTPFVCTLAFIFLYAVFKGCFPFVAMAKYCLDPPCCTVYHWACLTPSSLCLLLSDPYITSPRVYLLVTCSFFSTSVSLLLFCGLH